jgi:Tfp pilus assembly protein PilP
MLKKRPKRRRKRRNRDGISWGGTLLGCLVAFLCMETAGFANVVYKPMLPPADLKDPQHEAVPPQNLKNLPDPFLSYLVRKVMRESELLEKEKRKRQEAEEKIAKMKEAAAEQLRRLREPKTELQKLNVHQLLLTAIVESPDGRWAMVRDEKGMGYILKKGTAIGTMGGRVAKISGSQKKVIINEPYLEDELHLKFKAVVIELPDEVFQ